MKGFNSKMVGFFEGAGNASSVESINIRFSVRVKSLKERARKFLSLLMRLSIAF